jgi:ABC-type bacteriocin/lantibiotic exporter with double-glycine peptidase domain
LPNLSGGKDNTMLADIVWNQNTLTVLGTFVVPIVTIISVFWYKIERVKSENQLKQTMLQQGKSVEEIERVMAARSPKH